MKNSITKSNEIIEASYRLSLNEARIILYGLSLINPLAKEFPLEFKIDIKKFADMFNIASNNAYTIVKQATMERFWEREFTFETNDCKKMRVRWLTGIEYEDNKGYIKLFMNYHLKPFLHQLAQGNFTKYYLENIANFKSIYSVRFYELAIMEIKKAKKQKWKFRLKVEEIKERLELQEKYQRFSNFKATVLEPSKKEINKYSDIRFNYSLIKIGRSIQEIEFSVSKKQIFEQINTQPEIPSQILPPRVSINSIEHAKKIVLESNTRWDIYAIEQQFYDYAQKKGMPDNYERAFIGFVKKKVKNEP